MKRYVLFLGISGLFTSGCPDNKTSTQLLRHDPETSLHVSSVQHAVLEEEIPEPVFNSEVNAKIAIVDHSTLDAPFFKLSQENHRNYAKKHGYHYISRNGVISGAYFKDPQHTNRIRNLGLYWQKITALLDAANITNPNNQERKYEWLLWMDADALFTNMDKRLEDIIQNYPEAYLIMPSDESEFGDPQAIVINNGVFLIRNNELGRLFLERARDLYGAYKDNGCPEQDAMQDLIFGRVDSNLSPQVRHLEDFMNTTTRKLHHPKMNGTVVVPQRLMDSFYRLENEKRGAQWHPGDFIAHFNGPQAPDLRLERMKHVLGCLDQLSSCKLPVDQLNDEPETEMVFSEPAKVSTPIAIASHFTQNMKHAKVTLDNHLHYAEKHGYQYVRRHGTIAGHLFRDIYGKGLVRQKGLYWQKLIAVKDLLEQCNPDGTFVHKAVMWVDADMAITNYTTKIEWFLEDNPGADLFIAPDGWAVEEFKVNSGSWILRNTPWSHQFLNRVIQAYPHYKDAKTPEQLAIQDFIYGMPLDGKPHPLDEYKTNKISPKVKVLPQRSINSFVAGSSWTHPDGSPFVIPIMTKWQYGDFIAHALGGNDDEKIERLKHLISHSVIY